MIMQKPLFYNCCSLLSLRAIWRFWTSLLGSATEPVRFLLGWCKPIFRGVGVISSAVVHHKPMSLPLANLDKRCLFLDRFSPGFAPSVGDVSQRRPACIL